MSEKKKQEISFYIGALLSSIKNKYLRFKLKYKYQILIFISLIFVFVGYNIYNYVQNIISNRYEFNHSIEMINHIELPKFKINLNKFDLVGTSNYVWVIDAGHGGKLDRKYYTAGKRSPRLADGRIIYEGETNRDVVNRIYLKCREKGYKCLKLMDSYKDISLTNRKKTIESLDKFCQLNGFGKVICISIHSNASKSEKDKKWTKPKGWSIYTDSKNNGSDVLANIISMKMKELFPDETFRLSSDGSSRESDAFTMVKLKVPCVISENFFMTNKEDVKILLSSTKLEQIATGHFQAIDSIEINNIKLNY